MPLRGIRGAVQAKRNTPRDISEAVRKLLASLVRENRVQPEQVAACIFTMTPDLDADYPARAARELSRAWAGVPMLCSVEIAVPGGLKRVVRLLLLAETSPPRRRIRHVYLGAASRLRPDLADRGGVS